MNDSPVPVKSHQQRQGQRNQLRAMGLFLAAASLAACTSDTEVPPPLPGVPPLVNPEPTETLAGEIQIIPENPDADSDSEQDDAAK